MAKRKKVREPRVRKPRCARCLNRKDLAKVDARSGQGLCEGCRRALGRV